MTDFHSHILPCVDDGSDSIQMSLDMLHRQAEQGIDRVVATPHFYARHDNPDRFLARRAEAEARLRDAMAAESGLPELTLGAEVHYFSGISHCDVLHELTIDGKRCILIEMPPPPWTESMYRELEGLITRQNLRPIIAHVDRYIRPLRTYRIPQRLAELPVLVQANAEFFLHRRTQKFAMGLLRAGKVHVLGSDCHDLTDRPPNLEAAFHEIHRCCGEEILGRLREYEQMIFVAR